MTQIAKQWSIKGQTLEFGDRVCLMAILNVTPDSFSDGGDFYTVQSAVDQAKRLEDEGADILDIGGESTRPYSQPTSTDQELERVTPVLEKLHGKISIPISIDTTKAKVAEAALHLGASIINDISGLELDPEMIDVARKFQSGVCAMHMQGTPQTMQDDPQYENVVEDILQYLTQRKAKLIQAGIEASKICLDPGIGFGKTHEHNIRLVQNASRFHEAGSPVLVGHSRKGFIAKLLRNKDIPRGFGTLGVSMSLALQKIQILRIHDVAAHRQALDLFMQTLPADATCRLAT